MSNFWAPSIYICLLHILHEFYLNFDINFWEYQNYKFNCKPLFMKAKKIYCQRSPWPTHPTRRDSGVWVSYGYQCSPRVSNVSSWSNRQVGTISYCYVAFPCNFDKYRSIKMEYSLLMWEGGGYLCNSPIYSMKQLSQNITPMSWGRCSCVCHLYHNPEQY